MRLLRDTLYHLVVDDPGEPLPRFARGANLQWDINLPPQHGIRVVGRLRAPGPRPLLRDHRQDLGAKHGRQRHGRGVVWVHRALCRLSIRHQVLLCFFR